MTQELSNGMQTIMTAALITGFVAAFCCATVTVSLIHMAVTDKRYKACWIWATATYAISIMSGVLLAGEGVVMMMQYAGKALVMLAGK